MSKVSVLVFRGDPVDFARYRHTALFFEFADSSTALMQLTGSHGFFKFQNDRKPNFPHINGLEHKIPVATIPESVNSNRVGMAVSLTRVRNVCTDADWNCQNWVGDALVQLQLNGWVTEEERRSAIDLMAGVVLEAKDEPQ